MSYAISSTGRQLRRHLEKKHAESPLFLSILARMSDAELERKNAENNEASRPAREAPAVVAPTRIVLTD